MFWNINRPKIKLVDNLFSTKEGLLSELFNWINSQVSGLVDNLFSTKDGLLSEQFNGTNSQVCVLCNNIIWYFNSEV